MNSVIRREAVVVVISGLNKHVELLALFCRLTYCSLVVYIGARYTPNIEGNIIPRNHKSQGSPQAEGKNPRAH
jgi:hypothetical protein